MATIGMEMPSEIDNSLWAGWDKFIRTALAINPEHRYKEAGKMYDDLKRVHEHTSSARPSSKGNSNTFKKGYNRKQTRPKSKKRPIIKKKSNNDLYIFLGIGLFCNICLLFSCGFRPVKTNQNNNLRLTIHN